MELKAGLPRITGSPHVPTPNTSPTPLSISPQDGLSWSLSSLLNKGGLPGKFHRQRSLAGHSPWGCKESDTTGQLRIHTHSPRMFWTVGHHRQWCSWESRIQLCGSLTQLTSMWDRDLLTEVTSGATAQTWGTEVGCRDITQHAVPRLPSLPRALAPGPHRSHVPPTLCSSLLPQKPCNYSHHTRGSLGAIGGARADGRAMVWVTAQRWAPPKDGGSEPLAWPLFLSWGPPGCPPVTEKAKTAEALSFPAEYEAHLTEQPSPHSQPTAAPKLSARKGRALSPSSQGPTEPSHPPACLPAAGLPFLPHQARTHTAKAPQHPTNIFTLNKDWQTH